MMNLGYVGLGVMSHRMDAVAEATGIICSIMGLYGLTGVAGVEA